MMRHRASAAAVAAVATLGILAIASNIPVCEASPESQASTVDLYYASQPIPDHNMVSRSVEEASPIGGGGISNGFGGEGDALMRRERDHFFRSLKRSMPSGRGAAAMPMKMRGTDHFFRTLRSSTPDETNHFFRSLKSTDMDHYFRSLKRSSKDVDHYFRSLKRSPARSPATDPMSSSAHPAIWMKRSSEEPDTADGTGDRRMGVGGVGGGDLLLPEEEDDILDMCVRVARERLRRDDRGHFTKQVLGGK